MSKKQIVMGVTKEELEAAGVKEIGISWCFFLIEDMKKINATDCIETMKEWEKEGTENIGNDLTRLNKKEEKKAGYVELDVVLINGQWMIAGVNLLGVITGWNQVQLSSAPTIVGFGGVLFKGNKHYAYTLSCSYDLHSKPRIPIKARFWREG